MFSVHCTAQTYVCPQSCLYLFFPKLLKNNWLRASVLSHEESNNCLSFLINFLSLIFQNLSMDDICFKAQNIKANMKGRRQTEIVQNFGNPQSPLARNLWSKISAEIVKLSEAPNIQCLMFFDLKFSSTEFPEMQKHTNIFFSMNFDIITARRQFVHQHLLKAQMQRRSQLRRNVEEPLAYQQADTILLQESLKLCRGATVCTLITFCKQQIPYLCDTWRVLKDKMNTSRLLRPVKWVTVLHGYAAWIIDKMRNSIDDKEWSTLTHSHRFI